MFLTPLGTWTSKRREAAALNPAKSKEAMYRLQSGESPRSVFADCAEQCGECLFQRDEPSAPLNSEGRCSVCKRIVRNWGYR